jgi:transposase
MAGGETVSKSWELPDALWELMEPLLPVVNWRMGRPTEVDRHRVAAGIFYVLRTGIQWNAVPRETFGAPSTIYYYFQQWRDYGVFERLWTKALERYDELEGIDWLWQSIDGAMTKAPQGGEKNRPQSHRSWQVGHEAQPAG